MENSYQFQIAKKEGHFVVTPSHMERFDLDKVSEQVKSWKEEFLPDEDEEFRIVLDEIEVPLKLH